MGRGGTDSHPCESMSNDYRASSDRPEPMEIQASAFIKNVSVPWIFAGEGSKQAAERASLLAPSSPLVQPAWFMVRRDSILLHLPAVEGKVTTPVSTRFETNKHR